METGKPAETIGGIALFCAARLEIAHTMYQTRENRLFGKTGLFSRSWSGGPRTAIVGARGRIASAVCYLRDEDTIGSYHRARTFLRNCQRGETSRMMADYGAQHGFCSVCALHYIAI